MRCCAGSTRGASGATTRETPAARIRPQPGPHRHGPQGEGSRVRRRVLPAVVGRTSARKTPPSGVARIPRFARRRRDRFPHRRRNRRRRTGEHIAIDADPARALCGIIAPALRRADPCAFAATWSRAATREWRNPLPSARARAARSTGSSPARHGARRRMARREAHRRANHRHRVGTRDGRRRGRDSQGAAADAAGTPVASGRARGRDLRGPASAASIARAWRIGSFTGLARTRRARTRPAITMRGSRRRRRIGRRRRNPPDDILRFPRGRAPATACTRCSSASTSPTRPWTPVIAAACPASAVASRVRASEQRRCSRHGRAHAAPTCLHTPLPDDFVLASIAENPAPRELEFSLPGARSCLRKRSTARSGAWATTYRGSLPRPRGLSEGLHRSRRSSTAGATTCSTGNRITSATPAPTTARADRAAAMAEHGYHLQYLLYALAVDRYLGPRAGLSITTPFRRRALPLRPRRAPAWIDADGTPAGVFHHRPTAATLARLDALFAPAPRRWRHDHRQRDARAKRSLTVSPSTSCAGRARRDAPDAGARRAAGGGSRDEPRHVLGHVCTPISPTSSRKQRSSPNPRCAARSSPRGWSARRRRPIRLRSSSTPTAASTCIAISTTSAGSRDA